MKNEIKVKLPEWITASVAFIYYWIMGLYKLNVTPIWQDEAMEYYCSIPVKGAIRGVTQYETMYERMAYIQQQPPLYNWLMCIWLQIYDNEWWYRFSSVLFGFIAAIGLYMVIRKLCGKYLAAFSVVIYSSIYIIMYYMKEASEYSLLLMILFWGIYLYILMLEQMTLKRIVLFTVFAVTAVFTHYGAVFVIVPMAINVLIVLWSRKDKKLFRTSIILDALAGAIGGAILVIFYLIPQSTNKVSTLGSLGDIIIEKGNLFFDFLFSLASVFRWCMIDIDRDTEKLWIVIDIGILCLIFAACYVCRKTKKEYFKNLFWLNAAVFMLYYIVTKLNIYAYGWYGNRYNMFIFPLWFIMTFVTVYEFIQLLKESDNAVLKKLAIAANAIVVAGAVLYCCYGDYRVHNHWDKMDLRTVVSTWYENDGYEVPTLLDFHQRYAFVYYFTHSDRYEESLWENISYNQEIETYSTIDTGTWIEYLNRVYDNDLPEEMYIVTGQWNALIDAMVELGYEIEPVVDTTAKLYYAH